MFADRPRRPPSAATGAFVFLGLCRSIQQQEDMMTTIVDAQPFDAVMEITARPPVVFVSGHGSWLVDSEGHGYLDFIQGWAVNCLGHSPRPIVDALKQQAERLINCSPAFYNDQMIRLSELIVRHSGLHQVFLANSGAEAN